MASNRLLLSASKTKFIWMGGGRRLAGIYRSSVAVAFPNISFQDSVRDLGVILDQMLSFSMHNIAHQPTRSFILLSASQVLRYFSVFVLQRCSRSRPCLCDK